MAFLGGLEMNFNGLYPISGKGKESCCLVFPSLTKRKIRYFHVVVVQRWLRNAQKRLMHVQNRCFVIIIAYCFFAVLVVVTVVVA